MIHLDTNFLIQALVIGSTAEAKLKAWFIAGEELSISSIALSEFLCGPITPDEVALVERLLNTEPFLTIDASKAAELFNATGRRSRSLADCQIAAVALRCGASLATIKLNGLRAVSQSRIDSGVVNRQLRIAFRPECPR